ncbi:MAG: nucleotidyl transferase AbiEii/AbiGii toxin family protein [Verrucomicrobiota bacterium]
MDTLAKQDANERETYFREAAVRKGLQAHILEKDFWVCWTLKRLFEMDTLKGRLLFKGGTSLSKAHKAIERFSEDIDLSVQRKSLGFVGDTDPANPDISNKQRKRQMEALSESIKELIHGKVWEELNNLVISELGSDDWKLEKDETDPDEQSLAFIYPRTSITQSPFAYIKPSVKIEFGARSDHWPATNQVVIPYLSEEIPEALDDPEVTVKTLDAERTFWEKATILHQMAHLADEKKLPPRYSRHYCDLASMIQSGVGNKAAANEELLATVVSHKIAFYRSAWASYETATRGSLRLLPSEVRIKELETDLKSMSEMFFGNPPKLEHVLKTLRDWENQFNQVEI